MTCEIYANYHAECWATGKSKEEIQEEITRCEMMWHSKLPNPFPGNAHLTHLRIGALKEISLAR